ncbi:hypothetical protein MRX96_007049 [Rhipicephalus microplus]
MLSPSVHTSERRCQSNVLFRARTEPVAAVRWSKPKESPTRRDNGEDTNDFDDGLPLPLEELDSCSAHAPTEPDPSAPTDQGDIYASAHWNGVPRVQTSLN